MAGKGRLLLVLCAAFFLDVLGTTSVFAASPSIGASLALDATALQWVFTAATLPGGAFLLIGGNLADRFGGRRMFIAGLLLFVIASLGCGAASSYSILLIGRVGQGVGAGVFVPAALAVLVGTFRDEAQRTRALATWSTVSGVGATAGLLLGGFLSGVVGWRAVFLIDVPIGVVLAAAAAVVIPPGERRRREPPDVAGLIIFTASSSVLIYGLSEVPELGATAITVLASIGGVAGLMLFVTIERRAARPALPLRLLGHPHVAGGLVCLFAAGLTVDGLLFALTLLTQRQMGWSAVEFAAAAALMTVVSIASSWFAGRLVPLLGAHALAAFGLFALSAAGACFALCALLGGPAWLYPGLVLFGLGMGPAYVGGSTASLLAVDAHDAGAAGALQNIAFTTGSVAGVALYATILSATGAVRSDAAAYGPAFGIGAVLVLLSAGTLAVGAGAGPLLPGSAEQSGGARTHP